MLDEAWGLLGCSKTESCEEGSSSEECFSGEARLVELDVRLELQL